MDKDGNVESFLLRQPTRTQSALRELVRIFTQEGCNSYVKTIYLGFDYEGEMVGAAYPSSETVELALALPEDHAHPNLVDATHLTWRTLPVSIKFTSKSAVQKSEDLLTEAVQRVAENRHTVYRSNDHFTSARQRRMEERRNRRTK